ncbi:MAG: carbohydrate porin, partial [Phycisphaerae bacterium]|nr:carbohydrate porin [Phycisphaerae bacterium]
TQFSNRALNHVMNFPVAKGLGAFVKVWPTDWLYFSMAGIDPYARVSRTGFDTGFHGPAHFVGNWEFGLTPKFESANGKLPGNYKFGWWYNPRVLTVFKNTLGGSLRTETENGGVGFYLSFDQMVWKENNDPKDKQGLGLFFNYGFAHGDVNRVEHFWSLGGQYQGLIPTRDKDVLGLGVAQSMLSNQYRHEINSRADRETVYELYYAIQITPWCAITPDVQVITNPGGTKDARDALVGGVRVKIDF